MSTMSTTKQDYKVSDINLAELGRKEIQLAELQSKNIADQASLQVLHYNTASQAAGINFIDELQPDRAAQTQPLKETDDEQDSSSD